MKYTNKINAEEIKSMNTKDLNSTRLTTSGSSGPSKSSSRVEEIPFKQSLG